MVKNWDGRDGSLVRIFLLSKQANCEPLNEIKGCEIPFSLSSSLILSLEKIPTKSIIFCVQMNIICGQNSLFLFQFFVILPVQLYKTLGSTFPLEHSS